MHPARPAHQSPNRRPDVLSADHQTNDARLTNAPGAFQDLHDQSAQIVELREQLFDEFHHRLKNSLQMLYGLLQIAWSKTDSTEAREALSDTSRRIGAMGTAQQIFYSVHNSTDVSGQRLLEAVCTNARAFFSTKVSINYEAAGGSLPKETAVPLALALNELLTNAAKHSRAKQIRLTVGSVDHVLSVTVADDGIGGAGGTPQPGNGLLGMRERVAVFGGRLEVGPCPTGGYVLKARLPVPT